MTHCKDCKSAKRQGRYTYCTNGYADNYQEPVDDFASVCSLFESNEAE